MFIIRMICPECGGHMWERLEDDGCVCAECGAHVELDEMDTESVQMEV